MAEDPPKHHIQQNLCMNRPEYRKGKKLTAVKVYTVNDESKYLMITKVPDLKLDKELSNLCKKIGPYDMLKKSTSYPCERFEVAFHVKYRKLYHARKAKRCLDDKSFFGGVLHVFYTPECESIQDTREKLEDRRNTIAHLLRNSEPIMRGSSITDEKRDRVSLSLEKEILYSQPQFYQISCSSNYADSSIVKTIPTAADSTNDVKNDDNGLKPLDSNLEEIKSMNWKKSAISINTKQPDLNVASKRVIKEHYQPPRKKFKSS